MKKYKAKRDFVSPVLGNVFEGQKLESLTESQIKSFESIDLIEVINVDEPPADEPPADALPVEEKPKTTRKRSAK